MALVETMAAISSAGGRAATSMAPSYFDEEHFADDPCEDFYAPTQHEMAAPTVTMKTFMKACICCPLMTSVVDCISAPCWAPMLCHDDSNGDPAHAGHCGPVLARVPGLGLAASCPCGNALEPCSQASASIRAISRLGFGFRPKPKKWFW